MKTLGKLGKVLTTVCEKDDLEPDEIVHVKDTVRVVYFKDDIGYVQVIVQRKDMLDVEALNLELGRELRPLTIKRQGELRARLGTEKNLPIPAIGGSWITVFDSQVMKREFLEIPTTEDLGLTIPRDVLLGIYKDPRVLDVSKDVSSFIAGTAPTNNVNSCIRDFTKLKIRRRLDATIELPPLAQSARKLMELRTDPNANLNDLVEIIEMDPSLTASILRWAGSSFYAHAGEVYSIKDAVGRIMGFDLVLNLAMGLTLGGSISKPEEHPDGFMDYWQQSVWMAYASATICGAIPVRERPSYGMIYLTGLLHNFGYLILNHTFPAYFTLACRHWEANRHLDTNVVEYELLGITREQMASELFECWEMPEELVVAIREQKSPTYDGKHRKYVEVLRAARCLLDEIGFNTGVDVDKSTPYLERLGVNMDLLHQRMERLIEKKEQIDSIADMM